MKQRTDAADILQQIIGNIVPLLEIFRSVVREPDFARRVFPGQGFQGRSMARVGEATINGVPCLGLPNISNSVGRIFKLAFSAAPW